MLKRSCPGVNLPHVYTIRRRVLTQGTGACSSSFPVGKSHVPGCHQESPTREVGSASSASQTQGVRPGSATCTSLFAGTHVMQTGDLRAVMNCIKSNPESFIFFSTALVGKIDKPGNPTFYVLLIHAVITAKAYAQMSVDNAPNTCDP